MKYETDPSMPWVHSPEGYTSRTKLDKQSEEREDIGADSPPEVMVARALAYRASELTNYKKEFDDEIFSLLSKDIVSSDIPQFIEDKIEEKDEEYLSLSDSQQWSKALNTYTGRIDDGGWDDERIMDIAMGGEYHSDDYPESEYPGMERNDDVMRADHEARQMAGDIPEDEDWYSLSEPGPALPHGHPSISTGPRDIVHARLGQIYKENAMEADLVIWLEKNSEFTLVKPGTEYSGWWGTDVIDEESWYVDGPEEGPLNESRLARLAGLNESLSTARSEVGYSPTKASRHALHKARRASAAGEIDAQLASMEPGDEDDRTIGDIVPIGYDEWESKKDRDKKRREKRQRKGLDVEDEDRGEARQYLTYLALNIAYGKIEMSPDDIDALDILVHNEFRYSFAMDVAAHGPDVEAEYRRDEYYDDKEAGMYGEATIFNEARFVRLAGLNENDRREK